jgi:hypothetical protein
MRLVPPAGRAASVRLYAFQSDQLHSHALPALRVTDASLTAADYHQVAHATSRRAPRWAAWASFGFTFVGWLLTAIVVARLSGVFKRD